MPRRIACHSTGDGPGMIRIVAKCAKCGELFCSPAFDRTKLEELQTRHVQDVLPDWASADRELYFMSGLCDACWNRVMAPEDDNEET